MVEIIRWDITGSCNLKCKHCQASKYYNSNLSKKDLSTEQVFSIIDKISQIGVDNVALLGGEPLMRKDIIEILKYFKSKNIKTSLNTNLTSVLNII